MSLRFPCMQRVSTTALQVRWGPALVRDMCTLCAQCSWSMENDARRPATKQLVESLHAKIQMLETELAQLKGRPGMSGGGDQEPSTPLDKKLVFPPDQVGTSILERERPEHPNMQITAMMYRYIFDIDTSVPASNQPENVQQSLVCQWNRHLPQSPHFTRLEHDTVLSRCFKYGVTWLHCMLPEFFLRDMLYSLTSEQSTVGNQLRRQHYTPMLHCALLAYASAFSDDPEVRSLPSRARFARYSKQWLDFELERPSMGSVRALALLAEYHCGVGERNAGFMYMGMSIRAARSLMLMDDEYWLNGDITMLSGLVERDWHFWSVFCQGQAQSPGDVTPEKADR
ncbi:unnamed protein product [Rhizoctonia solani]|uniref:Xylanolytic transcriptional activator regulatory domain-containing protein n=1 Tax=Rhizoctonia solani TaxID=456999 RepID=A0A8H3H4J4_9AGAM|nr:unnamed protein product [Rhizoctonia solani]